MVLKFGITPSCGGRAERSLEVLPLPRAGGLPAAFFNGAFDPAAFFVADDDDAVDGDDGAVFDEGFAFVVRDRDRDDDDDLAAVFVAVRDRDRDDDDDRAAVFVVRDRDLDDDDDGRAAFFVVFVFARERDRDDDDRAAVFFVAFFVAFLVAVRDRDRDDGRAAVFVFFFVTFFAPRFADFVRERGAVLAVRRAFFVFVFDLATCAVLADAPVARPAHSSASPSANQSPSPGSGLKCFSYLPGASTNSSASAGGSRLRVMFGQIAAKRLFNSSQGVASASVSGRIALTGHSGSQTPQSMHSSG